MLNGFSLNLLSHASNAHSKLPRNPTPILVNTPITFQDDYFLTSFSSSLSHSVPHIPTPSPHLFTTNSVNLPAPALYPCLISCHHGIRVPPPIKAQPLHLCCTFQPSSFEELCSYSLIPFLSCINFPPLDHFKIQINMSSNSHLKK